MKKKHLYSQINSSLDFIKKVVKIVNDHQNNKYFLSYTDAHGLKARDHLFSLEGLLRLHIKTYSFKKKSQYKIASSLLASLKELEDLLGLLSLQIELNYKSHEVNKKIKKINISKILENNWSVDKVSQYKKMFRMLNFKTKKRDLKVMLNYEIQRINDKSDSLKKYIMKPKYTVSILEEGFHEWRRAIRWISIYLQFYKSDVSLIEGKKKVPLFLQKKFKDSPFMSFKTNDESLIKINKRKYYLLSQFIYNSGQVKESVESHLYLKNKKYTLGLEASCQNVYTQFIKNRLLEKLLK